MDLIEKDFLDNGGQSRLVLAKEKWSNTMWGWAVPKNSPYIETLNMGYLNKTKIHKLHFRITNILFE